jgi:hypothetical protein
MGRHEAEELQRRFHDLESSLELLESALAQRDNRIAELEQTIERACGDCVRAELDMNTEPCRTCMHTPKHPCWEPRRVAKKAASVPVCDAEVPEWCKRIVHAVYVVENGEGNYIAQLEAEELLEGVSRDQLRACGIKVDR